MQPNKLTFDQFAKAFCDRQQNTPDKLLEIFKSQATVYKPVGWFLAECHVMDSSRLGKLVVIVYGPSNTFKEVPAEVFSPHGLASDMSRAVAYTLAAELPEAAGPWAPPPEPPKKRGRK